MPAIEDVYRLSPMQEGILFEGSASAADSPLYVIQLCYRLVGHLDADAFRRALEAIVRRHRVLRTSIHWADLENPHQVVHADAPLLWEFEDWRDRLNQEAAIEEVLAAERQEGFRLDSAPLSRFRLIRLNDDQHLWIWTFHHIILEGWSAAMILKDVFACYEDFAAGRNVNPSPCRPYRDYITWLQEQDQSRAEQFWRRQLRGFGAATIMNLKAPPLSEQSGEETCEIHLSDQATANLQSLAIHHRLTLATLVYGAWALLLHRYCGERDVVFGSVCSGRAGMPGAESMVGLFVNTLVTRVAIRDDQPLVTWMNDLQTQLQEMHQYEYSSLADIRRWSDVPPGQTLFESLLVVENWWGDVSLPMIDGLHVVESRSFEGGTGYPLTAAAKPGAQLSLSISFDRRRFDKATVGRMLGHWGKLLEGMTAQPHRRLRDLELLSGEERQQLLIDWNATESPYPRDVCIHQLVEQQVVRTPNAVALVVGEHRLSYRKLNDLANQLALRLQSLGVGPESVVAVCLDRSVELVVSLLGIHKAGGAYVPLDPEYPSQRLTYMIEDSQARVLLTQQSLVERLPAHGAEVICLDSQRLNCRPPSDREEVRQNPANQSSPDNLSHVIYTSGSTGHPKGVAIEHRSVVALLQWAKESFTPDECSAVLASTSICFDLSVFEIFLPLVCGGRVVLAENVLELPNLPAADEVTLVNTVPSAMAELLRGPGLPASVSTVNLAGEPLQQSLVREIYKQSNVRRVYDLYGPSEDTTYSTFALRTADGPATIGRPIANTQVYILDDLLRPVPIGVTGELYIGGAGLARGYFRRPELTRERFVSNPFSEDPQSRLYKTGDLARYRSDGNIEFLGRNDNQVKIRGFRIELGEIEAVLNEHPDVEQAVVQAWSRTEGDQQLVAYVVARESTHTTSEAWRPFLVAKLPHYMLPSSFVLLDALPRTPNGKIDRRALPTPITPDSKTATHAAPSNALERDLAEIWCEVLGLDQIGVHDNFFDLGGHSLKAMRMVARIRDRLGVELPLRSALERPTIHDMAEGIQTIRWAAKSVGASDGEIGDDHEVGVL
jgi:amino acid adenylation domain-containing protein